MVKKVLNKIRSARFLRKQLKLAPALLSFKSSGLLSEEKVVRRIPSTAIQAGEEKLFKREISKSFNSVSIYNINEALVSSEGYIFSRKDFIKDSFIHIPKGKLNLEIIRNLFLSRKIKPKTTEKILVIHSDWSYNYFHWLCDALIKLMLLDKKLIEQYTLLLPQTHNKSFVKNSLNYFGFKSIQWFENDELQKLQNFTWVPSLNGTGNFRPKVLKELRAFFIKEKFYQENSGNKKIYLTRSGEEKRLVQNEDEVTELLRREGFHIVNPGKLDFESQIELFYQADVVLGLHGAAFTNMLFCRPSTKIIEMRLKGDDRNNVFYSMSEALDLKYDYLLTSSIEEGISNINSVDVFVDLEKLKEKLCSADI